MKQCQLFAFLSFTYSCLQVFFYFFIFVLLIVHTGHFKIKQPISCEQKESDRRKLSYLAC